MGDTRNKSEYRNREGYPEPTAFHGMRNAELAMRDANDVRAYRIINTVLKMLDVCDFELMERLHVKDRTTGREYD